MFNLKKGGLSNDKNYVFSSEDVSEKKPNTKASIKVTFTNTNIISGILYNTDVKNAIFIFNDFSFFYKNKLQYIYTGDLKHEDGTFIKDEIFINASNKLEKYTKNGKNGILTCRKVYINGLTHKEGDIFKGKWENNQLSEGTDATIILYNEIKSSYEWLYKGKYINYNLNGNGKLYKLRYINKDDPYRYKIYDGDWSNGKLNGKGIYNYYNDSNITWNKDFFSINNDGKYKRYDGNWKNGYFDEGTLIYLNGDIITGKWNNNILETGSIFLKRGDNIYKYTKSKSEDSFKLDNTNDNKKEYDDLSIKVSKGGNPDDPDDDTYERKIYFNENNEETENDIIGCNGLPILLLNYELHMNSKNNFYSKEDIEKNIIEIHENPSNYDIWTGDQTYDGYGLLFYKENDYYFGNWKSGRKNGFGIRKYEDGTIYSGFWKDNEKHYIRKDHDLKMEDTSKMTLINGTVYEGEFNAGNIEGFGTANYPDGSVYVGNWKKNKKNGKGTLITYNSETDKSEIFEGDWENDLFPDFKYSEKYTITENQVKVDSFQKDKVRKRKIATKSTETVKTEDAPKKNIVKIPNTINEFHPDTGDMFYILKTNETNKPKILEFNFDNREVNKTTSNYNLEISFQEKYLVLQINGDWDTEKIILKKINKIIIYENSDDSDISNKKNEIITYEYIYNKSKDDIDDINDLLKLNNEDITTKKLLFYVCPSYGNVTYNIYNVYLMTPRGKKLLKDLLDFLFNTNTDIPSEYDRGIKKQMVNKFNILTQYNFYRSENFFKVGNVDIHSGLDSLLSQTFINYISGGGKTRKSRKSRQSKKSRKSRKNKK